MSARKVAGLAFDLGSDSVNASPINSRAVSKLVGSVLQPVETVPSDSDTAKPEYNPVLNTVYTEIPTTKRNVSKRAMTDAEINATPRTIVAVHISDDTYVG